MMRHIIKRLLAAIVLPLVVLLSGCNSEGVFSDPSAVLMEIVVTPETVRVARGQTQQLTAMAVYSDGTSIDVSDTVTWMPVDEATTTVTPAGLLTGVEVGGTTVTALKDGFASHTVDVDVTDAVITGITVVPEYVGVVKGRTQPITVTLTYSDNTSTDVSDSLTWLLDTSIAAVNPTNVLSGVEVAGVEVGTTTLTVMKDGIISNPVEVNVCSDLAGPCIDVFVDTKTYSFKGGLLLYTSSPSVAYLDRLGGSVNGGTFSETGDKGPVGDFYLFSWNEEVESLCDLYNTQKLAGLSEWYIATADEIGTLTNRLSNNVYAIRGWPTGTNYVHSASRGSRSSAEYDLNQGIYLSANPVVPLYVTCTATIF
ncbi:Ig-like domain-containing protein [Photobacterium sp. GJ3]|uniref:Ig-like domain-containing protein n=1 Tax=Photobacterium sp. GJ3 TaxID=2829502 RepID=UPI001B8D3845|nr:Ig-like domain-containing protein [Photobacterium sp. GJ3]QUJ68869.1 Ig-like domain-containing protein [Photobacterium sp. GJ3]